ncbi:MAG: hypothetical protein KatS3mg115_0487 [Candidatus Poribacteria bacterium]|nr:MAG: hypothetical protein KatS3mg115_0487 [Candidatus Poribacteria bacterium]
MVEWLLSVPYRVLVPFAVLLLLSPFYPEPHVLQKLRMLRAGTLRRPVDILDLLLHLSLFVLLIAKVILHRVVSFSG